MIATSEPQAAATTAVRTESTIIGGRAGRRAAAVGAAAAALFLAGCGASAPAMPPTGPVVIGKGTVDGPIDLATTGPAAFSVRTVTVPPDGSTGWHTHDGTEMSIVKSGTITLVRAGSCVPTQLEAGDAVFIPDGTAHLARNDGAEPVEIVVTYLLAPDAPDRADAPAAC